MASSLADSDTACHQAFALIQPPTRYDAYYMSFHSGFVAILGAPNAGKSTLLNALVGEKVAIVSQWPQTTRNRILGIVNRPHAQIAVLDTPGLHHPDSLLGKQMLGEIEEALDGIEVLLVIVDAARKFGRPEQQVFDRAERFRGPRILLLNKIDRVRKDRLLPLIAEHNKKLAFTEIIPISALTGDGVELVARTLEKHLPEGAPLFPQDQYTDQPERFLAAEILREKVLAHTRREVPHAVAVVVDRFEEGEKLTRILATIYVDREGQKGIVIGRAGAALKTIGTEARLELEQILGRKVFLELFVKVRPDWRHHPAVVRELDWRKQMEESEGDQDAEGFGLEPPDT
ncbi:MAG TPA: GTPase Era [Candidatus Binatia bacterium]|nr:GTPase Era [Candidatus Binatia bacterium]